MTAGAAPSPSLVSGATCRREPFTCTFCWRQFAPSSFSSSFPNRPRVVGRSARLACAPCHAALLDLAVCWACGEVVCRGDECVSLGWCFWHRACYGCLLCGSRGLCRGVRVEDLFRGDGDGEEEEEQGGIAWQGDVRGVFRQGGRRYTALRQLRR